MYLVRLTYVSEAVNLNPSDIEHILNASRKNNDSNDISGILCFNRNYFLQSLEGGRQVVNSTYQRIMHDKRHANPVIIGYSEVAQRLLPKWSMAYVGEGKHFEEDIFRFSTSHDFNPYNMGTKSLIGLLETIAENQLK